MRPPSSGSRRAFCLLAGGALLGRGVAAQPDADAESLSRWTEQFAREVDHRLDVPPANRQNALLLRLGSGLTRPGPA